MCMVEMLACARCVGTVAYKSCTAVAQMNNFAKAKSLYEKYLSTYPDSSLAKMAKFELQNIGRSADDILKSLQDTAAKKTEPVTGK